MYWVRLEIHGLLLNMARKTAKGSRISQRHSIPNLKCFIQSCKHCGYVDCVKNLSPVANTVEERVAKVLAYRQNMYETYKGSQDGNTKRS